MQIKQDTLITLIISLILAASCIVLTFLLALIMMKQEPAVATAKGSAVIAFGGLVLVVVWFVVKAIISHAVAHWAVAKLRRKSKPVESEDDDIDLSDIPELDEKFFKDAKLTRPGEFFSPKRREDDDHE